MNSAPAAPLGDVPAVPAGRFGFAFAPRFFVLMLAGTVCLAPALWHPRALVVFPSWCAALFLLWLVDLARLPPPALLSASRTWSGGLALARPASALLHWHSRARVTLWLRFTDAIPSAISGAEGFESVRSSLQLEPGATATVELPLQPLRRGTQPVGDVFCRYHGAWGLAERWARVPLAAPVTVFPAAWQSQDEELALARSRVLALQRRMARIVGQGREFHHLREFRTGDEYRDINWRASARRGVLVSQVRRVERSQSVWLVLDCGRLMRARVALPAGRTATPLLRTQGLSKLDYAVSAALSVAEVALELGDHVGLLAYGRSTQACLPPDRGLPRLRALIAALAQATPENVEADHHRAAAQLLRRQRRRALVLWITDLAETHLTPEVIEAANHVAARHLVLFVAVRQSDLSVLARRLPATAAELYVNAAAQQMAAARATLLARMRRQGALTLEMEPRGLSTAVVNRYLEAKERGLLG